MSVVTPAVVVALCVARHLLALPLPRSAPYLAKWAAPLGLMVGSALVFVGLIALGAGR